MAGLGFFRRSSTPGGHRVTWGLFQNSGAEKGLLGKPLTVPFDSFNFNMLKALCECHARHAKQAPTPTAILQNTATCLNKQHAYPKYAYIKHLYK